MKECCWRVAPDGDFVARKSDSPEQQFLFEREADLLPLRTLVLAHLKADPAVGRMSIPRFDLNSGSPSTSTKS